MDIHNIMTKRPGRAYLVRKVLIAFHISIREIDRHGEKNCK